MAKTVVVYLGDGVTKQFKIPFDYLTRTFIKFYVNDIEEAHGYTWFLVDKTTIQRNIPPLNGEKVTIRRVTSADRIVEFKDASVLRSLDLNTSQLQIMHMAEEAKDSVVDTISLDISGNLDARNKRLVNVADPVSPKDALNLGFYQKDATGAYQSKLDAEQWAHNAKTQADRAKSEADKAQAQGVLAKKSADNAKESETTATSSAATAVSASNLAQSVKAEAEKIQADIKTDSAAFDAKLTQAEGHATNAATQAGVSSTQATKATSEANRAKTEADKASTSAREARTSEQKANNWSTSSEGHSNNSKTYADNSKASETTATASAATAVNAANLASTVKTEAEAVRTGIQTDSAAFDTKLTKANTAATKATTEANRAKTEADRAKASADSVDISVFESRVATLETDMPVVKADVATLKTTSTTHGTAIGGLKTEVSGVKTSVDSIRSDLTTTQTTVTAVQSDVTELKSTVNGHTASISNLSRDKMNKSGGQFSGDVTIKNADMTTVKTGYSSSGSSVYGGNLLAAVAGSVDSWSSTNNGIRVYEEIKKIGSDWTGGVATNFKVNNANTYSSLRVGGTGFMYKNEVKVPCIIESSFSSGNWFRRYDDGWIEQGGSAVISANTTLNYIIPFAQYLGETRPLFVSMIIAGRWWEIGVVGGLERSKTTFDIAVVQWTGTNRIQWHACGY